MDNLDLFNSRAMFPRKLRATPVEHTRQRQSPGNANYERNPDL